MSDYILQVIEPKSDTEKNIQGKIVFVQDGQYSIPTSTLNGLPNPQALHLRKANSFISAGNRWKNAIIKAERTCSLFTATTILTHMFLMVRVWQ